MSWLWLLGMARTGALPSSRWRRVKSWRPGSNSTSCQVRRRHHIDATEIKIQGGIHLRVMDHDIQLIFHQQSCTKFQSSFFCTSSLLVLLMLIWFQKCWSKTNNKLNGPKDSMTHISGKMSYCNLIRTLFKSHWLLGKKIQTKQEFRKLRRLATVGWQESYFWLKTTLSFDNMPSV